jgi:hypothetical protein
MEPAALRPAEPLFAISFEKSLRHQARPSRVGSPRGEAGGLGTNRARRINPLGVNGPGSLHDGCRAPSF